MSQLSYRYHLWSTLAALVACALPATLPAQSPLTLGDVYRRVESSPRIAAASAAAEAARLRIASTRRPPDPRVQLGFMNRELPSLEPMDPLGMTQIQVMQMIPTPGKLGLAGRVAAETARAASARVEDARWEMRARSAMAFYDLHAARAQLAIARQTRQLVQDVSQVARTMYSVGDGTQADVLRAQVEVARMSEDTLRMESMLRAMAGRLASLLDAPGDSLVAISEPPRLPDSLPPLAALIEEAERRRPMIAAAEREVLAATASERLARRELVPDLELGVQYGWREGPMGPERMGSLMIGASVPVFARSRQLRMREEAAAMRAMTVAEVNAMRAETRGRMTELYADFTRSVNLISLYRSTVLPQAEGAVSASVAAYRVGTVNLMTLLDNQMTVNRYRQELIALESTKGKAIAEMEMLLGRELFDAQVRTR